MPSEAIIAGAADVIDRYPSYFDSDISAFVIPNRTREHEQQALLEAAQVRNLRLNLLWRPVAAALAWEHHFHEELIAQANALTTSSEGLIGSVVCLHVGLTDIELTVLELRCITLNTVPWIVPVRRRSASETPTNAYTPSLGWRLLLANASTFLEMNGIQATPTRLWHLIFASRWLHTAITSDAQSANSHAEFLSGMRLGDLDVNHTIPSAETHEPQSVPWTWITGRTVAQSTWETLQGWCCARSAHLPEHVLGTVVTGEAAGIPHPSQMRLGDQLLSWLGLYGKRTILRSAGEGDALLAAGAALFAARLTAGLPTFRDTLPRLQLLVRRQGEMAWDDLLEHSHTTVEGGKVWQRPEPVRDLAIPRGSPNLTFAVYHEDYPGVRELLVDLPRICENQEPAQLLVEITPAQGAARLEVRPDRVGLFGHKRVVVDWKRMTVCRDEDNEHVDRDKYLARQPRIYPELLPRMSSYRKWWDAYNAIRAFLSAQEAHRAGRLQPLILRLQQKDPTEYPRDATAVGSDGRVAWEQETLDRFVESLWHSLQAAQGLLAERLIRCLGYTSTAHEGFSEYLAFRLQSLHDNRQAMLLASGHCLRAPKHACLLVKCFQKCFSPVRGPRLDWLKALAAVLQYRRDATQEIDSAVGLAVVRTCLDVFEQEFNTGKAAFLFRNAALIIVFMLRRRAFDNQFLDPGSELARDIKASFERAIREARVGRLRILGGAVDLPKALQQMIDYIDRRGIGSILMAGE